MIYTNIQVNFATYDTPLFSIWRAWDVPETANYVLASTPSTAVSDPNYQGFVYSNTAILFTKGKWNYTASDGFSSTFREGDGGLKHRKPLSYRVVALDKLNGKICVEPKDGTFWEREVVSVPNMESITLGPWFEDRYLFVGTGKLVMVTGELVQNTTPLKIAANTIVKLTSESAALALLMWKW